MQENIVEAIILAFTMGGIVGAAAALSLRSSRLWNNELNQDLAYKPVPVRSSKKRKR